MKTYKTWEMIRAISENPKKKYRPAYYTDRHVEFKNNQLVWKGRSQLGQAMIVTETDEYEWVEVKEPVDFMTAAKSGKRVTLTTDVDVGDKKRGALLGIYNRTLKELMAQISEYSEPTIRDIILHGKWYIED